MYSGPVRHRDEDEQQRRENMAGPGYGTRSPIQTHYQAYSPTNAYNAYSPRPPSAPMDQSPRIGSSAPSTNGVAPVNRQVYPSREQPPLYYDHASTQVRVDGPSACMLRVCESIGIDASSPRQPREYFENSDPRHNRSAHHSPISARFPPSPSFSHSHAHPPSRHGPPPQSPRSATPHQLQPGQQPNFPPSTNGSPDRPLPSESHAATLLPPKQEQEARPARADPMSFSNILSSNNEPPMPGLKQESLKQARRPSRSGIDGHPQTVNGINHSSVVSGMDPNFHPKDPSPGSATRDHDADHSPSKDSAPPPPPPPPLPPPPHPDQHPPVASGISKDLVEQALAEIDAMELSEVEGPEWLGAKENYLQYSQKRQKDMDENEASKRKVRSAPGASLGAPKGFCLHD
jgi:chromatin-remodeling ATPase INO80